MNPPCHVDRLPPCYLYSETAMHETTKAVLRALALSDSSLSLKEREALAHFAENGFIHVVRIDGPLMLNAKDSSELLGLSTDSFLKIRRQAEFLRIEELCGEELVPGSLYFNRIALVRLSMGEFPLVWPGSRNGTLHEVNAGIDARRAV
jgi:hypothetical protein